MTTEIFYGNLKECTYEGFAGNIFGVEHDKIIDEGLYFVKINENEYMRVDELLSNKKKKNKYKLSATKRGDIFVGDLILLNDFVEYKGKKNR